MKQGRGEEAISEVVGFVIILAVMVTAMSLHLTHAVPVQGREEEIEVMDGVRGWFVDYKTGVDRFWLNSPCCPTIRDLRLTIGKVTVRRIIDPGTSREKGFAGRYLPLLSPIPASAEVSLRTGDTLTIEGWKNGDRVLGPLTFDAPALVYTSHNNYWLQQEYSYQLGGVFLRQWHLQEDEPEKLTVIAAPPLSIYPPEGNEYLTKASLVIVNLAPGPTGFGGTSPVRVETSLSADPRTLVPDSGSSAADFSNVILTFSGSSHESAMAWYRIFSGAAKRNGINQDYFVATPPSEPAGTMTTIDIRGHASDPGDNDDLDVRFEALVADYDLRMENVPSMIQ